jgi:D-psicose/D-tagatose/L-ribulose 3-epimerase
MKYGLNSLVWVSPFSNKHLDLIRKAGDMGFDVFEIAVENPELIDCPKIRKAAQSSGISTPLSCAFGRSRDMSSKDDAIRANARKYVKTLIDFGAELDSQCISGPMYAAVGEACLKTPEERKSQFERAVESIRECADYAKPNGIKLAVEPLNRFETDLINTVDQGLVLVDEVGMDNVGLLLDTFHMNIEEKSITEAIRSAKGKILAFHSCANDRGTPGRDNLDWQAIKAALQDAGYNGSLIIESFTPDCIEIAKAASIWRPLAESPDTLASDGLEFLKSIFG